MKWVASGLLLACVCLAGCISAESLGAFASSGTEIIAKLEGQGVDYRAEMYLPAGVEVRWTPFGGAVECPGGYVLFHVQRGRGLGGRPSDLGTIPTE